MKERLRRQLGPDAQYALQVARRLTGIEPELKRVAELPNGVRALLRRPTADKRPHEIHFRRGEERVLEHLVAHEVGHLVRLYQVPEEERVMPALTYSSRRRTAEQLAPELFHLMYQGLPSEALPKLFDMWLEGVCGQLASFPADLRIEAWIHSRFPGLRAVQRRSLLVEVQRAMPSFLPAAIAFTPPTVYRATMAMNAAQASHVAELFGAPALMAPFERHQFADQGRRLARAVLDSEDEGHRSDVSAVTVWARELGLSDWYEWRPYTGTG